MDSSADYADHGLTSLSDSLDRNVVYRNLVPDDPRLPSCAELKLHSGPGPAVAPRKAEPAYGRIIASLLACARRLDLPGTRIRRLLYIGDTLRNDGTAFKNICRAGQWPGWAFSGREEVGTPLQIEVRDNMYLANRWNGLSCFVTWVTERGFPIDEETAVVVDIDKTFIGARGRNDKVIDAARVEAARLTVSELMGPDFDEPEFDRAYTLLNQPAYHGFTSDNQDHVAYASLMLGAGVWSLERLVEDIASGRVRHFAEFAAQVCSRRPDLKRSGLLPVHEEVWHRLEAGDPTPFKTFRQNEYLCTVARFGRIAGASADRLLAERITITQEVREVLSELRSRGAMVFGVSDKPDEASVPNKTQAAAGMKPLHELRTVAVRDASPESVTEKTSPRT